MAKWNLDYYQGENEYSEGKIEEELLEIVKSTDDYDEILREDDRWSILYHLSPLRENIVNWYPFDATASILEIGAGCGAITGALCEAAASVTSVELTKIRSAVNYERHKGYDNWELITGNFHNIQFSQTYDYIILNGVFEYAASFTHTDNPYVDFLLDIKKLLNPGGKIIIAIENRLGLKYFNGAREDHTGELFSGLNNYEGVDYVKTFSKNRLKHLFSHAGLKGVQFYYPIFDYKFPEVILTDETMPLMNYNSPQRVLDCSRLELFDEKEMIRTLIDEDIFDRFSNSFFIEVSEDEIETESAVKYAKISNYRKREFAISTRIFEEKGQRYVVKEGLNEESVKHIKRMLTYQKESVGIFKNLAVSETPKGVKMSFLKGKTLSSELIALLKTSNKAAFEAELRLIYEKISEGALPSCQYSDDAAFKTVFGKESVEEELLCKERMNIDMIFTNVFKQGDGYQVIDYEWCFDFKLPVAFVMWRILRMFYANNGVVRRRYSLLELLSIVGIDDENQMAVFESWDNHFVYQFVGTTDLSKYEEPVIHCQQKLMEIVGRNDLTSVLYLDYGEGFNATDVLSATTEIKDSRFEISYTLPVSDRPVVAMRWDPCEEYCKLKDIVFSQGISVRDSNSETNEAGWDIFLSGDPMYFIERETAQTAEIKIAGHIKKLSQHECAHFYQILKDQNVKRIQDLKDEIRTCENKRWRNAKPLRITKKCAKLVKSQYEGMSAVKCSVDTVQKADGLTEVYGWAFEEATGKPVDFSIMGEAAEAVTIQRINRRDIHGLFGLSDNLMYGFVIRFGKRWDNRTVAIKLVGEKASRIVPVDLSGKPKKLAQLMEKAKKKITHGQGGATEDHRTYGGFIMNHESMEKMAFDAGAYAHQPKISIIVPVYNVSEALLRECIKSVEDQWYTNWELCLVDDHSNQSDITGLFKELEMGDGRIKTMIRSTNGHISRASNDGLAMATGDFIALLDNDDILAPFALSEVIKCLNEHRDAQLIYSDEDKIDVKGERSNPFFKPDWSPETLMAQNYICHLTVIKKTLVDAVGGFEIGLEGAQDYDLVLKCTEKTSEIYHIPHILYHWRMLPSSTAENPASKRYAFDAGRLALENALKRRHIQGDVKDGAALGTYTIDYAIIGRPLISIVIPTKDHPEDLAICLESIEARAGYDHYEVIVIDNGSTEDKTKALLAHYSQKLAGRFRVLTMDIPFNYSALNNAAVKVAKGEYVLLLNNDINMKSDHWLRSMLGYAQQDDMGAVGVKLFYPDSTIQHGGVIIGQGGVAGHSHQFENGSSMGYFSRLVIPSNYSAVTAACLLVSKEKYDKVGGLEEEALAVAFNDVDFCLKLRAQGYRNVCLCQVEGIHGESKTRGVEDTEEKRMRFVGEVDYMLDKWSDVIKQDPCYNPNLTLVKSNFGLNEFIVKD